MSHLQNEYQKRLVEKLKNIVEKRGADSPQAEELQRAVSAAEAVIPQKRERGPEGKEKLKE